MKHFITVIVMIVCSGVCLAQDYYNGKTTVSGGGITYEIYKVTSGGVFVENINNTLRHQEKMFDDGTKFYPAQTPVYTVCQNDDIIDEIVRRNVPESVLKRMKETKSGLMIDARVSPKTEKAVEIGYWLNKPYDQTVNGACAISPSSLAAIERELKEKLVFKCSRKDLNYTVSILYSSKAPGNCASLHDDE